MTLVPGQCGSRSASPRAATREVADAPGSRSEIEELARRYSEAYRPDVRA